MTSLFLFAVRYPRYVLLGPDLDVARFDWYLREVVSTEAGKDPFLNVQIVEAHFRMDVGSANRRPQRAAPTVASMIVAGK